jgi:CDP-diacylglycerol--serine O-phosphatidyltransferase
MGVALRLARFNVAKEEEVSDDPLLKYFTGVPSPVGGGLALLPMIISFQLDAKADAHLRDMISDPYAIGFWLIFLAVIMVSHIPTFSSKQIKVPHKMSVVALAVFGLLIAGLINEPWPTLTFMGVAYMLSIPWSIRHYAAKKKSLAQGIKDPDDIEADE